MKIKISLILVLVLVVACSQQTHESSGNTEAAAKPVVKIGFVGPLTGDLAFIGEGMRNAIEMALEDLRETKYDYVSVYEDDQLQNRITSTATQKLISQDNVDALMSISSGTGNVVSPLTQESKVIHFGVASDSNIAKGLYNFIHWTPPEEEAKEWVAESQRRGYEKIAILIVQQQGAIAIVEAAKEELEKTNMEVVFEDSFAPGTKDFRTMITKSREENPDAYLLITYSPEIEVLYKQMKELGIEEPITSIEAFELSGEPELFEGEWYVNAAEYISEFGDAYEAKYEKLPALGTPNAYDVINLIVLGYETKGDGVTKPSHEEVANAIMDMTDFSGVLGTLNVGEEGIVSSPAAVKIIKDGKPASVS